MKKTTDDRFRKAVQFYWKTRDAQQKSQVIRGKVDAGSRGAVTGGTHVSGLENLVVELLVEVGVRVECIHTRSALELPGYYRPEKMWDLLVVDDDRLVAALEFKSQVGPSFGNNFNNRVEEAIGNATDVWTAYREGRFGTAPRPFLGYFFLLEDCPKVHSKVRNQEPHFEIDPVFRGTSYEERYAILCKRLVRERLYDAACLTLATRSSKTEITHPSEELTFDRFIALLKGSIQGYLESRNPASLFALK